MPKECKITKKRYTIVTKRSKSMQRTKTKLGFNAIKCKVGNKRVIISARYLKTLKKKLNIKDPKQTHKAVRFELEKMLIS